VVILQLEVETPRQFHPVARTYNMASPNDFEEASAWGSISQAAPGDILRDAMRKEAIIKYAKHLGKQINGFCS
jgi:hypothetical protein